MIPLPSRHLLITVALVVAGFFVALWVNERIDSYNSKRETQAELNWEIAKDNWAKIHERIVATIRRDSLASKTIDSARAIARSALAEANRIRTIRERVPVPVYTDSTNPVWRTLYVSVKVENDSLRSVIRADSSALGAALWARDSLRAVLLTTDTAGTRAINAGQKLIDVRTCKVLWFIRCPSRKVVAVASGAIGLAAGVYVGRQHSKPSAPPAPAPLLAIPNRGYFR
jgi:hypothetical protein